MTKKEFLKLHKNTIQEVEFYAKELNKEPEELITEISKETYGLDSYGNPSIDTFKHISKKYNLSYDVARHFYYIGVN